MVHCRCRELANDGLGGAPAFWLCWPGRNLQNHRLSNALTQEEMGGVTGWRGVGEVGSPRGSSVDRRLDHVAVSCRSRSKDVIFMAEATTKPLRSQRHQGSYHRALEDGGG